MNLNEQNLSANLAKARKDVYGCIDVARAICEGISGQEAVKEAIKDIETQGDAAEPNNLLDQAACLAEKVWQLQEWLQSIRADLGLPGPGPVESEK